MKTIVHEIPYSPASNLDEEIFTASSVFSISKLPDFPRLIPVFI